MEEKHIAAGVTIFLVAVILAIMIGGITQDAQKHREKMAMIEQGMVPPKSGFHMNVQIGSSKKKDSGRPKFWKISQGEDFWYADKYDGVDGRVWLLDGRMVDLDGDFRAEELWWEMLPEEVRRNCIKKYRPPNAAGIAPEDYGIKPEEDL